MFVILCIESYTVRYITGPPKEQETHTLPQIPSCWTQTSEAAAAYILNYIINPFLSDNFTSGHDNSL